MRIGTNQFRGELPHLAPEALPDQGAQEATNCRLESGNLESYRQFAETKVLANTGTVQTIFLAQHPTTTATAWLSFNEQVDIARNVVEDDPDGLLLLTCPELFDTPVYTTYATATAGAEPYPVAGSVLPLGVPGPQDIPVLVLGLDPTPTTFSIDVLDEGDSLDTEWITSPVGSGGGLYSEVHQDAAGGNPGSCYRLQYDESRPGAGPYAYRNFGIAAATLIVASTDFKFVEDDDVQRRAALGVATDIAGIGCYVNVYNGSSLGIRKSSQLGGWWNDGVVDTIACSLGHNVWYKLTVTMEVKANGTQTVTATVTEGVTQIATLTATSVFGVGDYCFISAASGADANPRYATLFDNIHVQASGATGLTPNLTATNYVYTFVNNRGWESVPSLPTEDILRPDGVSVTVTTSTTAPAGYSAVTHKRIYRLVSALTGDLFLLVAEIPLAQADYVDTLTDNQVGPDVLESQEFDLPPATLEGIQPLPNGGYSGFFGKQLCISAAGWPHAWPVRQRHSCEFDIVATGKLGNTIVVGTAGRVYTCTGTEPSNYVMSEPGEAQSCVSKRSMVYLDGQGVAYASPDGYQLCAGSAGNLRNLTENVFTKRQWREKNPSSIIGAVHDGVLHWYWETEEPVTATVLYLFHMIGDEPISEGIAEFTGFTTAFDQTGANWNANSSGWGLTYFPVAPKFGALAYANGSDVSWERDQTPSNPEVPESFSTSGISTLQMSVWVYIDFDTMDPPIVYEWSVGNFVYPAEPTYLMIRMTGDGDSFQAQAVWKPQDPQGEQTSNPGAVPTEQWVHLLLACQIFDEGGGPQGDVALYINGVLQSGISEVDLSGVLASINPINYMTKTAQGSGVLIDEEYAVLGMPLITSDFTPPVAPWPNP